MPNLSYAAHRLLMNWMRGQATTPPTQLFVGVMTSAPNADGTNVVEPAGGYARQPLTFSAPISSAGVTAMQSTSAIVFSPASVDWPQIGFVGVFTQDNTLLYYGALAAPRLIKAGDSLAFSEGAVQLRLR